MHTEAGNHSAPGPSKGSIEGFVPDGEECIQTRRSEGAVTLCRRQAVFMVPILRELRLSTAESSKFQNNPILFSVGLPIFRFLLFVTLAYGNQAKAPFANGDLIRTPQEGHVTKHVAQPA